MDIVNFPGIIAEHGLLDSNQVSLAKDLILIGKNMGSQRDGTQYENMAITISQFANLVSGGGNETLAQTLVLGNITGGNNIIFSATDSAVFRSGVFNGTLTRLPLTGNQIWSLPNQSGTIALLSDIPASVNIYNSDGALTANRTVSGAFDLHFANSGNFFRTGNFTFKQGANRILSVEQSTGFSGDDLTIEAGQGPAAAGGGGGDLILRPGNHGGGPGGGVGDVLILGYNGAVSARGSDFKFVSGNAVNNRGGNFDFITGNGSPIHLGGNYTITTGTGVKRGSIRFKDGSEGTLGHVWTQSIADGSGTWQALPAAPVTLYSGDGTIIDATRNVTIGTTLNFLHGAAGVNGYVQMTSGGYFKAQTSIPTNYLEYNNINGVLYMVTDTHTVTGLRAENGGGVGNPTALVELLAGGNGTAYLNTGATTSIFYILNNGGLSATNYTSSNTWSFGNGLPDHNVGLTAYGKGGTAATASQLWKNSSGTEQARFLDSGGLAIGINALTGGFANAARLRVDATVSDDYTSSVVFDQTYSNIVNNGNTAATLTTQLYKATAFNVGEMKAAFTLARNDGTGGMNFLYGTESMVWAIGAAAINYAFAYSARVQVRDGVIGNIGGLDISYQENNAPAVVTNMIGVLVRTPVNVAGITVTNTYGMLIQPNIIGTNNYGFVSSGQATNGFGTLTPSLNSLSDFSTTTKAPIKLGGGMTAAQASALTAEDSMVVYVTDTNGTFTSVGFWGREAGTWIKL